MVGLLKRSAPSSSCRGFPTDLPMVGLDAHVLGVCPGRGFPTDLPMVGLQRSFIDKSMSRGFPTDLPMVGLAV